MKVGRGEQKDLENVERSAGPSEAGSCGWTRMRRGTSRTALRMIRLLAAFEPEFIEQPTPAQSLAALKQVRDASPVPIAADQAVYSLFDVYEVCRQQAADVLVLSFHETGGLLAFKKAAAIAEAAGIRICLHGQSVTGMTDLAQHQVALTLPNLADGNQIMHQLLVGGRRRGAGPHARTGQARRRLRLRPGIGFELDWNAVARGTRAL